MTFSIVFRRAARIEFEKAAVWYDEQCTATWRRVHRRDRTSHRERGGRTSAVSTHFRGYTSRRCAALSVFGVLSSPFKQIGCPRSISRSSGSDDLAATGITPGGTDGQKRPAVHRNVIPVAARSSDPDDRETLRGQPTGLNGLESTRNTESAAQQRGVYPRKRVNIAEVRPLRSRWLVRSRP